MRKLNSNLNAFYIVCKLVTMLILEFDWNVNFCTKREGQSLINIFCSKGENVCYKDIQHDDLVAEGLTLLDNNCDLSILVSGFYSFLVD